MKYEVCFYENEIDKVTSDKKDFMENGKLNNIYDYCDDGIFVYVDATTKAEAVGKAKEVLANHYLKLAEAVKQIQYKED